MTKGEAPPPKARGGRRKRGPMPEATLKNLKSGSRAKLGTSRGARDRDRGHPPLSRNDDRGHRHPYEIMTDRAPPTEIGSTRRTRSWIEVWAAPSSPYSENGVDGFLSFVRPGERRWLRRLDAPGSRPPRKRAARAKGWVPAAPPRRATTTTTMSSRPNLARPPTGPNRPRLVRLANREPADDADDAEDNPKQYPRKPREQVWMNNMNVTHLKPASEADDRQTLAMAIARRDSLDRIAAHKRTIAQQAEELRFEAAQHVESSASSRRPKQPRRARYTHERSARRCGRALATPARPDADRYGGVKRRPRAACRVRGERDRVELRGARRRQ